jgi:hypothetical protein
MSFNGKKLNMMLAVLVMVSMFATPIVAQQMQAPQQSQPQTNYSEAEIDKFVETVGKVIPLQREGEVKMVEKIEEGGMELEKFNELATQVQTGSTDEVDAAELEKFQKISTGLNEVQLAIQAEMTEVIEESGMEMNDYQQMIAAYQSDQELRQTIDAKLGAMQQQ